MKHSIFTINQINQIPSISSEVFEMFHAELRVFCIICVLSVWRCGKTIWKPEIIEELINYTQGQQDSFKLEENRDTLLGAINGAMICGLPRMVPFAAAQLATYHCLNTNLKKALEQTLYFTIKFYVFNKMQHLAANGAVSIRSKKPAKEHHSYVISEQLALRYEKQVISDLKKFLLSPKPDLILDLE